HDSISSIAVPYAEGMETIGVGRKLCTRAGQVADVGKKYKGGTRRVKVKAGIIPEDGTKIITKIWLDAGKECGINVEEEEAEAQLKKKPPKRTAISECNQSTRGYDLCTYPAKEK
ncbi:hypothetical protein U1Q18_036583, partial [Sarracenia purpurea var. burkii]